VGNGHPAGSGKAITGIAATIRDTINPSAQALAVATMFVDREAAEAASLPDVDGVLTDDAIVIVEQFRSWGGGETREIVTEEGIHADVMRTWMAAQSVRTHQPEVSES